MQLPPDIQQEARDAIRPLPPVDPRELSHEEQLALLQERLDKLQVAYRAEQQEKGVMGFSKPPEGDFEPSKPNRPVLNALKNAGEKIGDTASTVNTAIKDKAVDVKDNIASHIKDFKSGLKKAIGAPGEPERVEVRAGDIQKHIDEAERRLSFAEGALNARQKLNAAEKFAAAPINKALDQLNPLRDIAHIQVQVKLLQGIVKDPEVNIVPDVPNVAGREAPAQTFRR